MPCPHATPALGCTATPYSDAELAQAVSAAAFEAYVRARMEMVESSVREEAEREGEERLRAELAASERMLEAARKELAAVKCREMPEIRRMAEEYEKRAHDAVADLLQEARGRGGVEVQINFVRRVVDPGDI